MSEYLMYLDGTQMPVTPSKLQLKIKGANKTLSLINDGEINFLRQPGLTEIEVPLLLPMLHWYENSGTQPPDVYLGLFEDIMTSCRPARFILSRRSPDGRRLFDTNMKVSIESYSVQEDASEGPDISVQLNMKLYKEFGTKRVTVLAQQTPMQAPVAVLEAPREVDSAPTAQTHTVVYGDCLWNLAKKYYGNGALYTKIYEANKDKVSNPNVIYVGQVLVIP